jgi:N-acetyl-gamma-glutamyl-phosphate reductase
MRTAVLGATGYTGLVLLRILAEHPQVKEIVAVSSSQPGASVRALDPGLPSGIEDRMPGAHGAHGTLSTLADAVRLAGQGALDVVFSCLPHQKSAEMCAPFVGKAVVIDLSADFRLHDAAPKNLPGAVYGLAEWHTDAIRGAAIIANPGCYPTATLLPLLPLAQAGLIEGAIIVNAISGISGAGKKEKADLLYCERSENANAYSPGTAHRHVPEIVQELEAAYGQAAHGQAAHGQAAHGPRGLLFTPHLAPLRRGMAVTTVVQLAREPAPSGPGSIDAILRDRYAGRPFISLAGSRIPQTREVWGSNRCDIGWKREGRHLMLFSVIDNLVKGASGQAVQNMNLRFGLPEDSGLRTGGEL